MIGAAHRGAASPQLQPHIAGLHKSAAAAPAGGVVDIQGVCKSTVAKGEDEFPDGVLRITDCHDSVIYALAPLQYASIACCSDCTVVVGAVGRMLRVERCERLHLIAGCARICISSCHESVFYLGVNQPPLMLGDNRFVQVPAPPLLFSYFVSCATVFAYSISKQHEDLTLSRGLHLLPCSSMSYKICDMTLLSAGHEISCNACMSFPLTDSHSA